MSSSSSLLYSLLLLCCFSGNVAAGNTFFVFQTFSVGSFKLLGEAHMFNNTIRLTQDLLVPNTGAGIILYNNPVRFLQPGNPTPVSFTTTFSFSISNLNPNSIGGGLAFVISPNDEAIGDGGGHLGVPNDAIAVEFDTCMDEEFNDFNGNHLGLDLDSMVSSHVADLQSVKVNLRSGEKVNCWIDYSGSNHQLNISISYTNKKPKSPILSISINLIEFVNEFMFVGFSGSTQGSTEVHSLQQWSFNSSFDANSPPPPPPSPSPLPSLTTVVNASEASTTPLTHSAKKQSKWDYLIFKIIIAMAAAVATGGTLYCIRNCFCCNECNVNNTSINCCIRRRWSRRIRRLESDVSSDIPIRKNVVVV